MQPPNGLRRATVTGTGLHAPGDPVPNSVFDERYGMDIDSFLVAERNIRQRHFMADDQATSDLVVPAAEEALAAAGLGPEDLDLVIVSTDTPDYVSPSTASVVQHKLGARRAGTFDVNTACAGFVTALDMAGKYVAADPRYDAILVVGAYGMSKHLDWDDYKRATLFADGAGAAIVRPSARADRGLMSSTLYADGQYHDYMGIYGGGTHTPSTAETVAAKDTKLRFAKRIPPETNIVHWPRIIHEVLDPIGWAPGDVNHFFFTQINIGSINATLDAIGVPHERSHNVMDRFGYTGSACIPMALADAARQHRLKDGDRVVFVGSGGGLAMAAVAMVWSYDT
jgi:3-oxoacyl-[acyl-carrier-protein] synthase III